MSENKENEIEMSPTTVESCLALVELDYRVAKEEYRKSLHYKISVLREYKVILDDYMEFLIPRQHKEFVNGVTNAIQCIIHVVICMVVGSALPLTSLQGFLTALFAALTIRNIVKYGRIERKLVDTCKELVEMHGSEMETTAHIIWLISSAKVAKCCNIINS